MSNNNNLEILILFKIFIKKYIYFKNSERKVIPQTKECQYY